METLKGQGNAAFAAGQYAQAIEHFTSALDLDPSNAVLFSNRSAAHAGARHWEAALEDAQKTVELRPDWAKGWGRRGAALLGLGQADDAVSAYERALSLEPDNAQVRKGLEAAQRAKSGGATRGAAETPNIFADPQMWERLRADPKMRTYLEDPGFVTILGELQRDPSSLTRHIRDPRVMQAFATMLGVQMKYAGEGASFGAGEGEPEEPTEATAGGRVEGKEGEEGKEGTRARQEQSRTTDAKRPETMAATDAAEEGKASEASTVEPSPTTDSLAAATRERELGNEAYRRRDFEAALQHYEQALSRDPHSVSLRTNQAAVYFEQAHYEQCIEACEEAITVGRAHYADYKLIAKALGRMGAAWERLGRLPEAILAYERALTEHRTPEMLARLREAQRAQEAATKAAYHDPALAEAERAAGNELFKTGDYAGALKHYSEAIRRDEGDARSWTNRAACYLKLAAVPEGLKDCERALALDPHSVKTLLRKAALLQLKRDYSEALAVLEQAAAADEGGRHAAEIGSTMARLQGEMRRSSEGASEEEILARAARDPEVREIMSDPVMMQILRQMQADPRAAAEHLRNPAVAGKIRKLVAAGIIKTA